MTSSIEAPAGALSRHALDLQRRLLREVIRRAEGFHVTGEVVPDAGQDPDPKLSPNAKSAEGDRGSGSSGEDDGTRGDRRQRYRCPGNCAGSCEDLARGRPATPAVHRPIAEDLTPEEILAFLERGDDPWAAGSGAEGPIEIVPIRDLLAACGLAQAFGEAPDLDALTAPGAITLVPVRSAARREALHKSLEDIVPTHLHLAGRPDLQPPLVVLRLDDPVTTGSRDGQITAKREDDRRRQDFDVAVARNAPMLILAGGTDALPDVARRLAVRVLPWPELTTGDIVEILRVTHSRTGCLSEEAIRAALPPAGQAAALPTILWDRALTEVSPIRVARRLAAFCAESPKPKGPTLADLHGQPIVRAELEALVRDVDAWRAGRLDW